jgi:peptidoglycan/LPS O-acetylase OafA/YrhL
MKPWDWLGIAIAACVCVTEIVVAAAGFLPAHMRECTPIRWLAPEMIWLSATLLIFVVLRDPERFMPPAPAAREWFKQVGQMTYPLYLTHSVRGAFIVRTLVHAGANRWLALAAAVTFALCFAYFIARVGEPAVRSKLRALWDRAEAAVKRAPWLAFLFKPGGSAAA